MARLSIEEIVALIKHSSLPTVFVEGQDDMFVFTRIEQVLGSLKASFLECGDKDTLLRVFSRRSEFSNIPCCFVADRDMWYFSGVPDELTDVVFTAGYSIENDLYSDSNIERILDAGERKDHAVLIREVSRWFSCEVDKYSKGQEFRADPQLSRLVPLPGFVCCPNYLATLGFYEPSAEDVSSVLQNYALALRGKLLYEIIVRFTHAPKRYPRRYSYSALMELSVVYGLGGPLITKIVDAIRAKLGISGEPQIMLGV